MQVGPHRCDEYLQVASDYLEGDLEAATAAGVAAHLRCCPECLRRYAELALTITAVRSLRTRAVRHPGS